MKSIAFSFFLRRVFKQFYYSGKDTISMLVRSYALGLLLMFVFCLVSSDAEADHFRYGSIKWIKLSETATTVTVKLDVAYSYKLGYADSNIDFYVKRDGVVLSSFRINLLNVTDPSGGWVNSTGSYQLTLDKSSSIYTIENDSSPSNLFKILELQNNSRQPWKIFTTINTAEQGSCPVSVLPAVINMPSGIAAATYKIPASDPDQGDVLSYHLANANEMYGTQPEGLSINSSTGELTFNTLGKPVGALYNAIVVVNDNHGNSIVLDFIIKLTGSSTRPVFDYSVTPLNGAVYNIISGQNLSFSIKATDSDIGSSVDLSVAGLPSYITTSSFSPTFPATGNPAQTTFNWTPTSEQVGHSIVLNFVATDNIGVQSTSSITIKVVDEPAPVFTNDTPTESSVRQILTGVLHQDVISAQSPVGSDVYIGSTSGIPSAAVLTPTVPTVAAQTGSTTLSWTPTPADFGIKDFTFQAAIEDKPNIFSTRKYSIIVNTPPAFSSSQASVNVQPGQQFTYNISVNDPDIPYGDIVEIGEHSHSPTHPSLHSLPAWLTLTSTGNGTAILQGTPSDADVGSYDIELQAEDIYHHGNPEEVSQSFSINVVSCPALPAPTVSAQSTVLCPNSWIRLTATGSNSIWYKKATGSGPDSRRGSGPEISVNEAGSYYAVSSNDCGTSAPSQMIVITNMTLPVKPSITVNGPTFVCNPVFSTVLTVPPLEQDYWINWLKDGSNIAGAFSASYTATKPGVYQCIIFNSCGYSVETDPITITLAGAPAKPVITLIGDPILCNSKSVTLTSTLPTNATGIKWSNGAVGNSIVVNTPGSYTAIAVNSCGESLASNPIVLRTNIYTVKKSHFDVVKQTNYTANATQVEQENDAIVKEQIQSSCDGSSEEWALLLAPALEKRLDSATVSENLRTKLIEVCTAGGSRDNFLGASTSATASASGYKSFGEVLLGEFLTPKLGKSKFTALVNPYLFDGPARQGVPQQGIKLTISNTKADICNKLAALEQEYISSQSTGSLYTYLKTKYKDAMSLTETELGYLTKSCNSCNYLLEEDVTLPVFMVPGAKGCITLTEYNNAKATLASEFENGEFVSTNSNYERILANYMNQWFGFAMSYDQYAAFESQGSSDPNAILCNEPPFTPVAIDAYACVKSKLEVAVANGQREYAAYVEEEKIKFKDNLIAFSSSIQANVYLAAKQQIYHHTLYYYDQVGNLIRTVPPAGVKEFDTDATYRVHKAREFNAADCEYNGPDYNSSISAIHGSLTSAINGSKNNQGAALEFWAYQVDAAGGQILLSAGKDYMVQVCFKQGAVNADIFSLTDDGTNKVGIVRSNHISGVATNIFPWNHIVIQSNAGADLASGDLELWLNGKNITPADRSGKTSCGWEIGFNPLQMPENTALLKHLRLYSRVLLQDEIRKNAFSACLKADNMNGMMAWHRYNMPYYGAPTTIASNSRVEYQYQPAYPPHTLTTTYTYNTTNQVIKQATPDAKESNFWYDELSRLVISQNAKQKATSNYSYTKYDVLGRIIEVGQKNTSAIAETGSISTNAFQTFLSGGTNSELTQTIYDEVPVSTPDNGILSFDQSNLRKRVAASIYRPSTASKDINATYYSYDISGNVKTLWQQVHGLGEEKRIDYEYDLISGKVNLVAYQKDKNDAFYYQYKYDAENRLTQAYSSIKAILDPNGISSTLTAPYRKLDASYQYYLHGPLARIELGDEGSKVQGMDYAYTLQGWLKGVNSNLLSPDSEINKDGATGSLIPKDALAYSLGYFNGDYKPIGTTAAAFNIQWQPAGETGQNLYNGNISHTTLGIKNMAAVGYTYKYDQLNRLIKMRQHDMASTAWGPINNKYKEEVQYDANGNILKYDRYGANGQIDKLIYNYYAGTNRLSHVDDGISGNADNDLKDQAEKNYDYDEIGNLVKDVQENIASLSNGREKGIEWTVYGKISQINRANGTYIKYSYDAAGNRISKNSNGITTWYIRDAEGNSLGVYDNKDGAIKWQEQQLYGSSRLGMWKPGLASGTSGSTVWGIGGKKFYELNNHLGNVLAVISDNRGQHVSGNVVDYYEANVVSAQDYYPFGMIQPGRSFSSGSYRYGFNGKENDNDVKGEGNQQDYGMRIYDPRLGRFLSEDPITKEYPELTPYQFASNRPIDGIDLDGLEFVKPPVKSARTLLVVPQTAGTERYSFNRFYNAALKNNNIDVMKVNDIVHLNNELTNVNKRYDNILIADHGAVHKSSQKIGDYYYRPNRIESDYKEEFKYLGTKISTNGNLVLLGCFTGAEQYQGDKYLTTVSTATNRNVLGNQGETIMNGNSFSNVPLGQAPPKSDKDVSYYPVGILNAGKWSLAKPDGTVDKNIGNIKLNDKGNPSSVPPPKSNSNEKKQ